MPTLDRALLLNQEVRDSANKPVSQAVLATVRARRDGDNAIAAVFDTLESIPTPTVPSDLEDGVTETKKLVKKEVKRQQVRVK